VSFALYRASDLADGGRLGELRVLGRLTESAGFALASREPGPDCTSVGRAAIHIQWEVRAK